MTSVDPPLASGQLDFVGSLLVADTRAFVSEWRECVGASETDADPRLVPGDDPMAELQERSKTLQIRARAAGVGGLAHHLASGEECLRRDCDRQRLEECLGNILELTNELEQEMELQRASSQGVSLVESVVADGASGDPASVSSGVAEPPSGPPSPAPIASPWPGWKRLTASAEPSLETARSDVPEDGAAALSQLLGLTPVGGPGVTATPEVLAGAPSVLAFEPVAELLPTEFVVDAEDEDELTDQDLAIPLHLSRRTGPYPLLLSPHEVAIELPPRSVPSFRKRRRPSRRVWLLGLLALGVLGSLVALALVLTRLGGHDAEARADGATVTRSGALLPQPRARVSEKGLYVLLAQAHGTGESSQLAQLIDDEAASLAKAMTERCAPGLPSCQLSEQGRQLLEQKPPEQKPLGGSRSMPADEWLTGLHLPPIGVLGDARTQKQVEAQTEGAVGRELFQNLLFQCAAFEDVFRGALTKRGLPFDLVAVAMVESGCAPDPPESPLGARGLWQFTRVRARAYHLLVQPRVIDERLNATKATAAALDLLSDLHARLGSWQLALASYQLGPFSVITRARQLGAKAEYRQLASEGLLPPDTLDYVAKVEAVALILANLEHFHFAVPPERVGSASTALRVPAGTRLGLVARAVGTSTSRIRELNPDLIAEMVPGAAGEEFALQVPGAAGAGTRAQLEQLIADGAEDCVPLNFDWGRQRLPRAMSRRCKP